MMQQKRIIVATISVAVLLFGAALAYGFFRRPAAPTEYSGLQGGAASGLQSTENDGQMTEITLPILDEINQNTTVGTAGSSMAAVRSAARLLDWGAGTGLDPIEIKAATVAWLADKGNDEQVEFAEKLALVYEAYQKIISGEAEELLASAGCENVTYQQSELPIESIEAVMEAVGLK